VHALVDRLCGPLEQTGDLAEVRALVESALARGTSAQRQRALYAGTGSLRDVVLALVAEGQRG